MSSPSDYPWNVEIEVGGVAFDGPGMESEAEAQSVLSLVADHDDVQNAEVIRQ